jgi:VWFA-related protein
MVPRVLVLVVMAAATLLAQPRFQSGVELLRLGVTVVDEQGKPITDLSARDFSVTVDGQPRAVRFAQLYESTVESSRRVTPAEAAPLPSYALNTTGRAGRVVVFAVDLMAIKQGYEWPMLDTAAKLVDSLAPEDAVGLMPIPGKGVDLTRDRSRVADALRMLRGTINIPFIRHYFTIREAVAFEQLDRRIIREVIERECCEKCTECPNELRDETREFLVFARQHVQTVLTSLTSLAGGLQSVAAPKTIVLLSAGLPFDQENLTRFTELQRALARAGIVVYSVQADQPDADAASMRRPGVGTYQANDIQTGLANVATMSGGALFSGVGTASGVFDRLRLEISSSYELGVEATASDADGKPHDVKVSVTRAGATVRSRRQVVVPETPADPAKRLGQLLAQPVDLAELPIAVAAYSVRGDERDTLKVIISAEIGRDASMTPPARYALVIMKTNEVSFQTNDTATAGPETASAIIAAQLAPGRYRLRCAAVDAAGRGGTVELPLSVGLRAAGALQTSDLIAGTDSDGGFRPAIQVNSRDGAATLIELYSADPSRFATVRVTFELRRAGDTRVLSETTGTLRPTDFERRQIADGRLDLSAVTPGEYLLSATIFEDGKPTGRVSRQLNIRQ